MSLIHEKSYPAIAVKEILVRADVGRSAFYAHFSNKDALLASGIEQMLHATEPRALPTSVGRFGKVLSFSFPVFDYIGRCRHAADAKMGQEGSSRRSSAPSPRVEQQDSGRCERGLQAGDGPRSTIPADLAAEYIVTTFMLVLHWWVESRSSLSAREVDDLFLALVVPAVTTSLGHANG